MIANNPLISVVVPVYNAEKYIGECIESVLRQTYKEWELILVDDCGKDFSMSIAKDYASKDDRINIVECDYNVGPMEARERGYRLSKGDFITFLDSDDILPNIALELLLYKAKESGADIVSGTIEYFFVNGTRKQWENNLTYGTDKIAVYKAVLKGDFTHNLCGKLFRGSLIRDHQYSHLEHFTNGEDAIFFYEIVNNIEYAVTIPEVVYEYRQNPISSSQTRFTRQGLENVIVANAMNYKRCLQYPELIKPAFQYFSICLNGIYANGYNIDGSLDTLLKKYGLTTLVNPLYMFKYIPLHIAIKHLLKKYLKSIYINK